MDIFVLLICGWSDLAPDQRPPQRDKDELPSIGRPAERWSVVVAGQGGDNGPAPTASSFRRGREKGLKVRRGRLMAAGRAVSRHPPTDMGQAAGLRSVVCVPLLPQSLLRSRSVHGVGQGSLP